ncbi:hypothetical protein Mal15_22000 [Stieleria maiorica]|uniref:Uncharacterized protein n=1 Tax=Stieleria maiorica TaxID=2795974 RepID=A0A5B9MA99_9BACT|nr:hypothetical protein [Stieleria maiorica]QEF98152.1 hypothetical protein Mal15_22000 [Stieleria maiorica]
MYTPTGIFSTKHQMRLLLSQCATVQSVLGAADAAEALPKIQTHAPMWIPDDGGTILVPPFQYPRFMIDSEGVEFETSPEGSITDVGSRVMMIAAGFYVPDLAEIEDESDQEAWVDDQFGSILEEAMTLQGTGESIPGQSHLCLLNPSYGGATPQADDERDEEMDSDPDRPRWLGMLRFEVR